MATQELCLVDGHAHLEQVDDLPESLREAREAGVCGIVAVGMDIESNKKALGFAGSNSRYVYPALGYHPWELKEETVETNLSFIRGHLKEGVALGEVGLDYRAKVKKVLQWEVFGKLLEIAREYDKPVIIHCRYSHQRAFEMVMERKIERTVFHWYSDSVDLLDKILSAGYLISATPALAYSPPHREAIKRAPIERILLETDTPVIYQGKEARPKDVFVTLEEVARLKGMNRSAVAEQTTANASQSFGISFQTSKSSFR